MLKEKESSNMSKKFVPCIDDATELEMPLTDNVKVTITTKGIKVTAYRAINHIVGAIAMDYVKSDYPSYRIIRSRVKKNNYYLSTSCYVNDIRCAGCLVKAGKVLLEDLDDMYALIINKKFYAIGDAMVNELQEHIGVSEISFR